MNDADFQILLFFSILIAAGISIQQMKEKAVRAEQSLNLATISSLYSGSKPATNFPHQIFYFQSIN